MFSYPAAWAWGHRKGIITYTQLLLTQQTPSNTFRFVTQFCTHPVCVACLCRKNSSFVYLRLSRSRPVGWILRSGLSVPNRWKTRITKGLILCCFLPFFDPFSFVFNGSICFSQLLICHSSDFSIQTPNSKIWIRTCKFITCFLRIKMSRNCVFLFPPQNNKIKKVIVNSYLTFQTFFFFTIASL